MCDSNIPLSVKFRFSGERQKISTHPQSKLITGSPECYKENKQWLHRPYLGWNREMFLA